MRRVAVLCAARNSVYHQMEDVDVYDLDRDARTFPGGLPVVAHPPCRAWSAYCAHQAKPEPGEKELGIWCCEQLRQHGGVLEQPAHSRLFAAAKLPIPGLRTGHLWSLAVRQSWWGHPVHKATWLCFSRINQSDVEVPLRLRDTRGDRRGWQVMSKNQRSATCPEFADWLVNIARIAGDKS